MTIAQEEIFGPVLSIIPYDTEDEAIAIANDTVYGLAGGVWSGDAERAKRVARQIRTGQVDVNGGGFNPLAPFGGYKQSGIGRELGKFGLEEFLEVKSLQLVVSVFGASRRPLRCIARVRGMPAPVRVAVTGAAGQIGYSLLFRIASPARCWARTSPSSCSCSRSRRRSTRCAASRWSSRTARSRSSTDVVQTDDPNVAFDDANYALLVGVGAPQGGHGAQGPARGQRHDLHRSGQGALRQRGGRHQDPRRRQPGQHQLPDRDEQRAEDRPITVHRDDPPRPQPGRRTAREPSSTCTSPTSRR